MDTPSFQFYGGRGGADLFYSQSNSAISKGDGMMMGSGASGSAGSGVMGMSINVLDGLLDEMQVNAPESTVQQASSVETHADLQQVMSVMDQTTRVSNELLKVVSYIVSRMDQRGFGYRQGLGAKSRKRGRAENIAREDLTADSSRYPPSMVGLECPVYLQGPEAEVIGRLHALLQSLRSTSIWDKAVKPPNQDDAYPLSQQTRSLFSAMDNLADCNPSSIRPSALHNSIMDLSLDLGSAPSRSRRWNAPSPFIPTINIKDVDPSKVGNTTTDKTTSNLRNTSYIAEDSLSVILSQLLRPHSYEFEQRWLTTCPLCKLESQTEFMTFQLLDITVPEARIPSQGSMQVEDLDRYPLQSLVSERMKGSIIPHVCVNEDCPTQSNNSNINNSGSSSTTASVLAHCRPQVRGLPALLFIFCRKAGIVDTTQTPVEGVGSGTNSGGGNVNAVRARLNLDSVEFGVPVDDFVEAPFRVVAGLVRVSRVQATEEAENSAEYAMIKPVVIENNETQWIVCNNDKVGQVPQLQAEDERNIEVLICESLNVRR